MTISLPVRPKLRLLLGSLLTVLVSDVEAQREPFEIIVQSAGARGVTYTLQSSSDLKSWEAHGTFTVPAEFRFSTASIGSLRHFRAISGDGRGADIALMMQPASQTVLEGETVVLDGRVAGDLSTEALQWYKNNVAIPGATNLLVRLPNATPKTSGSYRLQGFFGNKFRQADVARVQVNARLHSLLPVPVTGWNRDVVTENQTSRSSASFDGYAASWFEAGVGGHDDGLPASRQFTSMVDGETLFELQPYNQPNVLFLSDTTTRTLSLAQPAAYAELAIVAASGSGSGLGEIQLQFADGTSSQVFPLLAPDWFTGTNIFTNPLGDPDDRAIAGVGRNNESGSSFVYEPGGGGFGFGMYQTRLDLVEKGLEGKVVQAIRFRKPAEPLTTGVFAVSGRLD